MQVCMPVLLPVRCITRCISYVTLTESGEV